MKKRIIILSAIGVVMTLIWFFLLFSPTQSSLDKIKAQQSAAVQQHSQLQAQLFQLRQEAKIQQSKRSLLTKMKQAIPTQSHLSQILFSLDSAAKQSGVTLVSVSPSPPTKPAPTSSLSSPSGISSLPAGSSLPAIKITLSVSGNYYKVLDFMNRINSLPRIVVISDINLVAGKQSATNVSPTLTAQFSVQAFVNNPSLGTGA